MVIFFTASLHAKVTHLKQYQAIFRHLQQRHTVLAEHVFNIELNQVTSWSPEYHFKYYQTVLERIKLAEVVVAEVTAGSLNVGYEIGIALQQGKPVIALYEQGSQPQILEQVDQALFETKILAVEYQSRQLFSQLDQALADIGKHITQRFTLLLPTHLMLHLETVARERGVPRSVYVRHLIEADFSQPTH